MTLPPVLVVGSSFQLWSAGLLPSLFVSIDILLYLVELVKRFSCIFKASRAFFRSGFFWPDLVRGGGGYVRRCHRRVMSEITDNKEKALFKNSAKQKKAL